ncbi:hypothetical protein [Shewanella waksmanii]|uniref:hypothetical protein n=1 Tax=Shewanella waksmanii TaxID=213783 RepID=UPI00373506B2
MRKLSAFLLIFVFSSAYALDSCNECHDEKWQQTPAHIWIDTEHHIDAITCMDCHRWREGNDLPPVLPSKATLEKDCGLCHHNPDDLAEKMNMQQYEQLQD